MSTAPSLKDRLAFGALTIAAAEQIPSPNVNSQPAQSMVISSPVPWQGPGQGPDVTAFLTSPDHFLTPKKALKIPPFFLKSPFRPASKPTNSMSMAKPALLSTTRRPSENTVLRRPLQAKDVHRRPSDSYGYGRRPRPSSFMKNLPPPVKGKLTRDPSLLDSLLKPVPKTPPNRNTLKSPSVLPSSEAHLIPPIPHVMMQLDTPARDAEKLIADMSQFSLDPKCDDMISSPIQKAVLRSNNDAMALAADENEMQYEPLCTQSSPGIEVPSQDDSWCRPAISQSSPIKSILPESSDPLDMFHPIRFPPVAKRLVANNRSKDKRGADAVSGSSIEENLGGKQGFKRSNKVYGKRARKSVHFAREGRCTSDEMDLSEDEILLK